MKEKETDTDKLFKMMETSLRKGGEEGREIFVSLSELVYKCYLPYVGGVCVFLGNALITVATGPLSDAEAERIGLVSTHAYAVLSVVEVKV